MRARVKIGKHTPTRPYMRSVALILSLVVAAFVMAASLEPTTQSWLGWVTLLPLFYAIRTQRPLHAMLLGGLWGCLFFVFGVAIFDTGINGTFQSFALLTGVPAAYSFFGARLTRWIGFSPFVLGVCWMGVELALETVGLHQGLLAGTQGDGTMVHWLGGALGYVLVAFTVAFINAVLIAVLSAVYHAISASHEPHNPTQVRAALCPQTFKCFPLFHIPAAQPRAPPA